MDSLAWVGLGVICLKNLNFKAWVHPFLGFEVWILYQYWIAVLYTMDSEVGLFGPSQKSHQPIFKDKPNKLVPWLVFSKDIRKIIAIRFMSEKRWEDILAGPKNGDWPWVAAYGIPYLF
jgi:hypothetical protein